MTEYCLGPDPNTRPSKLGVPHGACDCHAHLIGPPEVYPYLPERSYTPPPASIDSFLALHRILGLERAVIVQHAVHGNDNQVTLDAIAQYGPNARGVAVVDDTVADSELARLNDGGIRGVRFNVLFGGDAVLHALESMAERIADMNWHLQLLVDARHLVELAPRLRRLPVPVMVDHLGRMNTAHGIEHPGFQALLDLLREGICWVKLSANYRISAAGPPFADAVPFARALIEASPKRIVWGSDWPHPGLYDFMPEDGDLLDALDDYAPEQDVKHAILVNNPERLYGF